ncbi:transposase IS605 OrfB family [methanogenic archaeon ISO4-H5]|nr:transposase IS605 OrfB family [methanogenic archaeon ISO4-H5]
MPYRTVKIQLFPKPEQEKRMLLTLHACRATYNDLNEYCRDFTKRYDEWRESMGVEEGEDASLYETDTNPRPRFPSEFELTALAGEFREINLWRREAYSAAVWDVGRRIHRAYQRWFDSLVDDSSAGKPRFRTDGRYDSFTYTEYNQYRLDTQGLFTGKKPRMFLGGVGWVRSSDNGIVKRVPTDCMKQAVVSRKKMGKSNKWYITIFCECLEIPDNRTWYMDAETPDPVGLDLGARRVATLNRVGRLGSCPSLPSHTTVRTVRYTAVQTPFLYLFHVVEKIVHSPFLQVFQRQRVLYRSIIGCSPV